MNDSLIFPSFHTDCPHKGILIQSMQITIIPSSDENEGSIILESNEQRRLFQLLGFRRLRGRILTSTLQRTEDVLIGVQGVESSDSFQDGASLHKGRTSKRTWRCVQLSSDYTVGRPRAQKEAAAGKKRRRAEACKPFNFVLQAGDFQKFEKYQLCRRSAHLLMEMNRTKATIREKCERHSHCDWQRSSPSPVTMPHPLTDLPQTRRMCKCLCKLVSLQVLVQQN